jgi:hypothetical protein
MGLSDPDLTPDILILVIIFQKTRNPLFHAACERSDLAVARDQSLLRKHLDRQTQEMTGDVESSGLLNDRFLCNQTSIFRMACSPRKLIFGLES